MEADRKIVVNAKLLQVKDKEQLILLIRLMIVWNQTFGLSKFLLSLSKEDNSVNDNFFKTALFITAAHLAEVLNNYYYLCNQEVFKNYLSENDRIYDDHKFIMSVDVKNSLFSMLRDIRNKFVYHFANAPFSGFVLLMTMLWLFSFSFL